MLGAGTHGTTFGGSPLACAVALKILEVTQRWWDQVMGLAAVNVSITSDNAYYLFYNNGVRRCLYDWIKQRGGSPKPWPRPTIAAYDAKARQAFTNLTGSKTLSECPDQGCATSWLTIVTKIKRSFEELAKPDEQALFRETLVKPGLTPDERDSALENIVVGSALPF